jgi:hypothetical protein
LCLSGQEVSDHWLGRGGPNLWPLHSPDLTPLDFLFWGFVKDIVYHEEVQNMN